MVLNSYTSRNLQCQRITQTSQICKVQTEKTKSIHMNSQAYKYKKSNSEFGLLQSNDKLNMSTNQWTLVPSKCKHKHARYKQLSHKKEQVSNNIF